MSCYYKTAGDKIRVNFYHKLKIASIVYLKSSDNCSFKGNYLQKLYRLKW